MEQKKVYRKHLRMFRKYMKKKRLGELQHLRGIVPAEKEGGLSRRKTN